MALFLRQLRGKRALLQQCSATAWRHVLRHTSSASSNSDNKEAIHGTPDMHKPVFAVDRTKLYTPEDVDPFAASVKQPESDLTRHLKGIITYRAGPITVAEYMSEVLANPNAGYYTSGKQVVFGEKGDFITSPDICQVFGELIGVWCVALWQQQGKPEKLRVVELGPGRGSLMADLLRSTTVFGGFSKALEVHMVEVSAAMRRAQYARLQCGEELTDDVDVEHGVSQLNDAQVFWHRHVAEVPTGCPTIYLAHELLDALPVHQFHKMTRGAWEKTRKQHPAIEHVIDHDDDNGDDRHGGAPFVHTPTQPEVQIISTMPVHRPPPPEYTAAMEAAKRARTSKKSIWRERLVDIDQSPSSPFHFRFALAPNDTPASKLLLPRRLAAMDPQEAEALDRIEICPQAMSLAQTIAQRIAEDGGGALFVDYGREGPPYGDSLQAIRRHTVVSPLDAPGTADLSCWVDFGAIKWAVEDVEPTVGSYGPMTQQQFLLSMGLVQRAETLLQACQDDTQREALEMAMRRLVEGNETDGMGESYKVLALVRKGDPVPAPFPGENEGERENEERSGGA